MLHWCIQKILSWYGVPNTHQLLDSLPEAERDIMKQEAAYILNSRVYKWLMEDLELSTERWMFMTSQNNMQFGKGMLYLLKTLQESLQQLKQGKKIDSPDKKTMRRFK